MNHPPETLRRLFWDVEFSSIDCRSHAAYIINRVSDYGDLNDWKWLLSHYGAQRLREVVCASRQMSKRSANLWRLILDIPREEIDCLRTSSPRGVVNF